MQVFDPHLTIIRPKQGIVRRDPVVRKFMYQCLDQQVIGNESFTEVIRSKFHINPQALVGVVSKQTRPLLLLLLHQTIIDGIHLTKGVYHELPFPHNCFYTWIS